MSPLRMERARIHQNTPGHLFQATRERPGVSGRVLPRPEQRSSGWGAAKTSTVLIFQTDILPRVWVGGGVDHFVKTHQSASGTIVEASGTAES